MNQLFNRFSSWMNQLFNNGKIKHLIHVLLRNMRSLFLFCRLGLKDLEFLDYLANSIFIKHQRKLMSFLKSQTKHKHGNYLSLSLC